MVHPFDMWSRRFPQASAWLFFTSLLLTIVYAQCLGSLDQRLVNHEAAFGGIVSFELAGSVTTAQAIVDSWTAEARRDAIRSLVWDYGFIFVYVATLSYACLMAGKYFDGQEWAALSCLAFGLAWGQVGAGLLDAAENGFLLYILHAVNGTRPIEQPWPALAACCAYLKFALIGSGICCVLTAVIFSFTTRQGAR